jgi:hypothetical protein
MSRHRARWRLDQAGASPGERTRGRRQVRLPGKVRLRRQVRLRGQVQLPGQGWFPVRSDAEVAEMIAEGEDPSKVTPGDKLLAFFYLTSVFLVPITVVCWTFGLWGDQEIYYVIPLFAAGAVPWLLVSELCEAYNRSGYSLLALRAQLWLHLGGGVPAAVRALRDGGLGGIDRA